MDIEDQTLAQGYTTDNFTTSPIQDEYAPVIFSQKTVSHIVSIDMMSGKVCFWDFLSHVNQNNQNKQSQRGKRVRYKWTFKVNFCI